MDKIGPVSRVMSPMLVDLLANWRHAMGKAGSVKNPLSRFMRHAENLIILERDGDGYRYCHYGRSLSDSFDPETSGATSDLLPLEALSPSRRSLLFAEYDISARTGSPLWRGYTAAIVRGRIEGWQRLALPIGKGALIAGVYPVSIPMEDDEDEQGSTLLRLVLERVPVVLDVNGRVIDLALSSKAYSELKGGEDGGDNQGEAPCDALTGVCLTRYFERLAMLELKHAQRMGRSFSLLILNVDHFAEMVDSLGAAIGGEALKMLVGAIRKTVRDFDIVGRLGQEKFAIGLVNANEKSAEKICERLNAAIGKETMKLLDGRDIKITISIGCVSTTTDCKKDKNVNLPTLTDLLARAEIALHRSRSEGKGCISFE